MGLVNEISDFICRTNSDSLPLAVIDNSKDRILDLLGIVFSGCSRNIHAPILKAFNPCTGPEATTVIGQKEKLHWGEAAFVNSSMCSPDMTDGARAAGLHPGVVVIPAAMAAAEFAGRTKPVHGRELIVAVALGYEVMVRIGRAMIPSTVKKGFHITSIVGALASTTAVGKIMHLNATEMSHALAIACTWSSGLVAALTALEPFAQVQIGRICEAGITSVKLAQQGIVGVDTILENGFLPAFCDEDRTDSIIEDIGKDFIISQTYIKLHAGCRHMHAPMDAAAYIVKKNNIVLEEIEKIIVNTYSLAIDSGVKDPKTADEAKYNMPFGIAVLLVYGDAFVDRFSSSHLGDKKIRQLMDKITIAHDPELDREYPDKRGTKVMIRTTGGREFLHSLDLAKGEPELPLSAEEIKNKFIRFTSQILGPRQQGKILDFIYTMDSREDLYPLYKWLV
ncbi:MAG: MmgE/PrpD family protein [Thermodesulfobacteriota bacterium]